jgi:DNA polymerase
VKVAAVLVQHSPVVAASRPVAAGAAATLGRVSTAAERREELKAVWRQAASCTNCPQLAATRKTVVFGSGNADADVMFVGEAPGAREDEQGVPFVGQAGRLLDTLLGEIGLARGDVFVANVLKCRPPQNRDPLPQEIDACQGYLLRQLELIRPRVVCTLGNFATKLLRGEPTGITRLHGREELRLLGPRRVRLLPLYHPAAALYTPSMAQTLRADFARIPELLALPEPEQPASPAAAEGPVPEPDLAAVDTEAEVEPEALVEPEAAVETEGAAPGPARATAQLGLF